MALIPYEPFRQLEQMRREFDRFFPVGFPADWAARFDASFAIPRIDVYETEKEVVATCDLPGLERKEDVNIDIENNVLTISGTVKRVNEIKEEQMHRHERFVGRFQRSVSLPARVNAEGVRATYKNGVLEIRMPKMASEERRRIDVEFLH
ncbi:Hsp20/alpha crystallin family protein [Bacillaceae bacterium]